ncbi:hypothetical protein AMECASPLE_032255, partial [Ameca splendens]
EGEDGLCVSYLLLSGPLCLCMPLYWLCLLRVACNQLLLLSLLKELNSMGKTTLPLFQHVWTLTVERTPKENTQTQIDKTLIFIRRGSHIITCMYKQSHMEISLFLTATSFISCELNSF